MQGDKSAQKIKIDGREQVGFIVCCGPSIPIHLPESREASESIPSHYNEVMLILTIFVIQQ